jgi:hypothetical protein
VTCMPCVVCYPLPRPTPPHSYSAVGAQWQVMQIWYLCHTRGWVKPTVYQGMYVLAQPSRHASHGIALRLHPHTISVCAAASASMKSQQFSRPLLQRLLPPILSCSPLTVDCVPRVRHTYACTVFLMRVCRARAPCSGTTLSLVTWKRSCFPA